MLKLAAKDFKAAAINVQVLEGKMVITSKQMENISRESRNSVMNKCSTIKFTIRNDKICWMNLVSPDGNYRRKGSRT